VPLVAARDGIAHALQTISVKGGEELCAGIVADVEAARLRKELARGSLRAGGLGEGQLKATNQEEGD
jgi:hypothetical protein